MLILKHFKSSVFGSADPKGVMGVFFVSADSTGFRVAAGLKRAPFVELSRAPVVRITICDNTIEGNTVVIRCQGPKWEEPDSSRWEVDPVDEDRRGLRKAEIIR